MYHEDASTTLALDGLVEARTYGTVGGTTERRCYGSLAEEPKPMRLVRAIASAWQDRALYFSPLRSQNKGEKRETSNRVAGPAREHLRSPPPPPTRAKAASPLLKPRGTVPAPPPVRAPAACTPSPVITPPAPAQPLPPAVPEVDPEKETFHAREEAIKKQREAHTARLRQLEQEEE
ncbi:hypothetical protein EDD18DRAFT_1117398 [Armillaria luteobubalina]|uniref:Uncharacterized protein n=1 Tax=Armillaria luteobubalina TaxID=153913 RepID=A0AA39NX66_9AGAR|nr:hypothetical protein EDD18DRAFT_1117398 [Armillaria luteobubalina]